MGVNGTYPAENPISGGDKLLSTSEETGKTTQITVDQVATYAQTMGTGKQAIYDGATDLAPYQESFLTGDSTFDLRLGFSGPRTDETYFPTSLGTLMVNQFSAPAKSSFDFRFLSQGLFVKFEVSFIASMEDSGFNTITPNENNNFNLIAEYPNGDTEIISFVVPTATNAGVKAFTNHKFTFSTYIKDELTDSLLGGGLFIQSLEAGTDIVTISDLKVRAII